MNPQEALLWLLGSQHPQPVYLGAVLLAVDSVPTRQQVAMVTALCHLQEQGLVTVVLEGAAGLVALTERGLSALNEGAALNGTEEHNQETRS